MRSAICLALCGLLAVAVAQPLAPRAVGPTNFPPQQNFFGDQWVQAFGFTTQGFRFFLSQDYQ